MAKAHDRKDEEHVHRAQCPLTLQPRADWEVTLSLKPYDGLGKASEFHLSKNKGLLGKDQRTGMRRGRAGSPGRENVCKAGEGESLTQGSCGGLSRVGSRHST